MAGQTKIAAYENDPYLVAGPAWIPDADGNQCEKAQEPLAPRHCGASTNKPFCAACTPGPASKPPGGWGRGREIRSSAGEAGAGPV